MDSIDRSRFIENEIKGSHPSIDAQRSFYKPTFKNSQEKTQTIHYSEDMLYSSQIYSLQQNKKEEIWSHPSPLLTNPNIPQKLNINNIKNKIRLINSLFSQAQQPNDQFDNLVQNDDSKYIIQKDSPKSSKHKKFAEEEDEMLRRVVMTFGPKNWKLISSFIPGRTPRQCRDRYANYLAPGFIRTEWTEEEDKLLAEKFFIYGTKWTQIRQFFPFRTANDIKNRYNYTVSLKFNLIKYAYSDKNENSEKDVIKTNPIEKENDDIEKVSNDIFLNADFAELNPDQLGFYNEELQINEFDYSFIN